MAILQKILLLLCITIPLSAMAEEIVISPAYISQDPLQKISTKLNLKYEPEFDYDFCEKNKQLCHNLSNEKPLIPPEHFNFRGEPASKWHWATFWTLQALDVYTTDRGMEYDCVYEVNPLLPEKPTLERLVLHKSITLIPFKHLSDILQPSDQELFLSTALTGLVVINNFKVIDRAKQNCNKIR